jgi:hypothetical protein
MRRSRETFAPRLRSENIAAAAELRAVIDGKIGRKGSSVISRQPAGRKKLTGW